MFILIILISGLAVGYVASIKKNTVPTAIYIITALIGATVGAFLSFGDSPIYIQYPILNIWTVTITSSILFTLVVLLFDRSGFKLAVIPMIIIVTLIAGLFIQDSKPHSDIGPFIEKINEQGVLNLGAMPIEGFDAYLLKQAFPGLLDEDFDGVQTFEGIYSYDGNELTYTRTQDQPITSAEQTISNDGMETLYNKLRIRYPQAETVDEIIKEISGHIRVNEEAFTKNDEQWVRHTDEAVGLQFEYRKAPFGYVVLNPNNHLAEKTFVLYPMADLRNQPPNSEGQPTLSIEVFNPGPNVTPNDWIVSYEQSNYIEGSPIKEHQIENNVAIRYEWEGLYKGETAVVARKGWVYSVSVMYLEKDSQIYRDFEELISSLKILVIQ